MNFLPGRSDLQKGSEPNYLETTPVDGLIAQRVSQHEVVRISSPKFQKCSAVIEVRSRLTVIALIARK
jgi:hypothetical protein